MFGSLGPGEIILILVVLLLVFGAKRLPELGSALGKGIREFKSSVKDIEGELTTPHANRPSQQVQRSEPQQAVPPPQQPMQAQQPQPQQPVQAQQSQPEPAQQGHQQQNPGSQA